MHTPRSDFHDMHVICRYQWVLSSSAQQDCVVDQRSECSSNLLAVTSSLDCQWFSVSDVQMPSGGVEPEQVEESHIWVRVQRVAVLKKADLCTKLRKLDFRKLIICT